MCVFADSPQLPVLGGSTVADGKYEYKIIEGSQESVDRLMNERAAEGWEVGQMACVPGGRGESHIVVIMRRPREA